ncbi:MAG: hypothetical protein HIU83_16940 [Proteobacteria bacterium]|nr:hypothetical protein [Pseudomonadota bacterium]
MFTALWSLFLFLLGLTISGVIPILYQGSLYWFAIPFLIHAASCSFLSFQCHFNPTADLVKKKNKLFVLLPVSAIFPMLLWPGGDDGPGMAWMFGVGGVSIVSVAVGILTSYLGKVLNRVTVNKPDE